MGKRKRDDDPVPGRTVEDLRAELAATVKDVDSEKLLLKRHEEKFAAPGQVQVNMASMIRENIALLEAKQASLLNNLSDKREYLQIQRQQGQGISFTYYPPSQSLTPNPSSNQSNISTPGTGTLEYGEEFDYGEPKKRSYSLGLLLDQESDLDREPGDSERQVDFESQQKAQERADAEFARQLQEELYSYFEGPSPLPESRSQSRRGSGQSDLFEGESLLGIGSEDFGECREANDSSVSMNLPPSTERRPSSEPIGPMLPPPRPSPKPSRLYSHTNPQLSTLSYKGSSRLYSPGLANPPSQYLQNSLGTQLNSSLPTRLRSELPNLNRQHPSVRDRFDQFSSSPPAPVIDLTTPSSDSDFGEVKSSHPISSDTDPRGNNRPVAPSPGYGFNYGYTENTSSMQSGYTPQSTYTVPVPSINTGSLQYGNLYNSMPIGGSMQLGYPPQSTHTPPLPSFSTGALQYSNPQPVYPTPQIHAFGAGTTQSSFPVTQGCHSLSQQYGNLQSAYPTPQSHIFGTGTSQSSFPTSQGNYGFNQQHGNLQSTCLPPHNHAYGAGTAQSSFQISQDYHDQQYGNALQPPQFYGNMPSAQYHFQPSGHQNMSLNLPQLSHHYSAVSSNNPNGITGSFSSNTPFGTSSSSSLSTTPFATTPFSSAPSSTATPCQSASNDDLSGDERSQYQRVTGKQDKPNEDLTKLLGNILPDDNYSTRAGDPDGLAIPLFDHQRAGVAWMQSSEAGSNKGGILADDMGLGKTIQAIALMISRRSNDDNCKTTLIVCPLALLEQWKAEILAKVKHDPQHQLSVYIAHNETRKLSFDSLKNFDIVITTYGRISSEYTQHVKTPGEDSVNASNSNLTFVGRDSKFYRVILDEAQNVKNHKTKSSLGVCLLNSTYRWCMTGTPMQNSVEDLFSLIKFLRIPPYCRSSVFNQVCNTSFERSSTRLLTLLAYWQGPEP
jgi:hypothetical protein